MDWDMRPPAVTSRSCLACRARTPEAAVHRMHHRRLDRRRAGWRESKRRNRIRQGTSPIGWLHELRCDGNHSGNRKCTPIAVYGGE